MAIYRVVVGGELYGVKKWANVWHVDVQGTLNSSELTNAIADFYSVNAAGGGLAALNGCAGTVATGKVAVHMSTISIQAVVSPAPPIVTTVDFKGGQNTAGGLPVDVSLGISWRTALAGRSFRGRTYLPPYHENQNDDSTGDMPTPLQSTLDGLAINCSTLLGRLDDDLMPLVVYSRKLGTGQAITGGYIDNEWDTQRRRSKSQPKVKTSFSG